MTSPAPAGPKILITGTVVSNGGDRAILEVERELLRRALPDAVVSISDNRAEVARRIVDPDLEVLPQPFLRLAGIDSRLSRVHKRLSYHRVLAAGRVWARTGIRALARPLVTSAEWEVLTTWRGFALSLHTGGTTLVEAYWMTPKVFEFDLARVLGVPYVLLPQSLGPFRAPANIKAMRRIARHAASVMVRDDRSLEHLRAIGADVSRVRVIPDVVFALADETSTTRLRERRTPDRELRVAISVRQLDNYKELTDHDVPQRFSEAMVALVTDLVRRRGARVTFVSTCQGIPDYWTDDSAVATAIAGELPSDVRTSVTVDREFRTTAQLVQTLAGFDVLVGTRLHACILGLAAGTLVLPVAYEFKTHTVFGQLGAPELVLDSVDISGAALAEGFDRLLQRQDEVRPRLADGVEQLAAGAGQSLRLALQAIDYGIAPTTSAGIGAPSSV